MSGIIKRWRGYDYLAVSWENDNHKVIRLGFVHRQAKRADWVPVVQAEGQLVPLAACVGLSWALKQLLNYHERSGTITRRFEDDATYTPWRGMPS